MHGSQLLTLVNEHEETRATTRMDLDSRDDVSDAEPSTHIGHNQYGKTESRFDV